MTCPHCDSPFAATDTAGNPWYYCCGSTKTFRSMSCLDREPLATKLRAATERIKQLEREVELLRLYGNKDCIAQADEVLKKEAKP